MTWYYADAGRQVGPIADAEWDALVQAGTIKPDTLVWHEGMIDWQPFDQVRLPRAETAPSLVAVPTIEGGYPCSECRRTYSPDDMLCFGEVWVCANCKPIFTQRLKEGARLPGQLEYAGVGIRFLAKLVDGIIVYVINLAIGFV